MIYDIVISDQAETDLREIFEYIAFELQAQMAASDFGALCRKTAAPMGEIYRQKNIFLTD